MSLPLLQFSGISKRFGGVVALNDVSLNVDRAEVVALIGGITAGTVTASQAVVVSATKTIGTFLSVTATTFIGNLRMTVNPDLAAAGTVLADAAQLLEGFTDNVESMTQPYNIPQPRSGMRCTVPGHCSLCDHYSDCANATLLYL